MLLGGAEDKAKSARNYMALAAEDIAAYRSIDHDPDEIKAFNSFTGDWQLHLEREKTLAALISSGQNQEAIAFFHDGAFATFRKAARELRQLVDLTHLKAQAARAHGRQTIATAQRFISDLILAMLALFAGLAFYLWHSFSRPLLQLAGSMRRLSLNDTHFKIPAECRRDEIGEMAQSLAVLRRNTIELLETRKNLAMQAGILAGTLERERELTAAQRNFLTTMSHEFRTPLTYIDGHAQRLIATRRACGAGTDRRTGGKNQVRCLPDDEPRGKPDRRDGDAERAGESRRALVRSGRNAPQLDRLLQGNRSQGAFRRASGAPS